MKQLLRRFILIVGISTVCLFLALPAKVPYDIEVAGRQFTGTFGAPSFVTSWGGVPLQYQHPTYRKGLDIQGGVQLVLLADMSQIAGEDRETALESVREIIHNRVDQFGITEPVVRTAIAGDSYRVLVELPGAENVEQALSLVGQTAQLSFQLVREEVATDSAQPILSLEETGLGGAALRRASVQFNQQTGEPVVAVEFNDEGSQLFADITTENTGSMLAIIMDDFILMTPVIQVPIVTGTAEITGGFTPEQARQLAIQLNAGALPVPVQIAEQRTVGASLGEVSIQRSIQAGVIGLSLVVLFLLLYYGKKAVLASIAIGMYIVIVLALYKIIGITLTLPAITGMFLSTALAVDAMILIFERYKEELRAGRSSNQALHQAFARAWTSIKDANTATAITALVLINPLDFSFLNTGGMVRGFGITLLLGIMVGLFTGVVVIRNLLLLFLAPENPSVRTKIFSKATQE